MSIGKKSGRMRLAGFCVITVSAMFLLVSPSRAETYNKFSTKDGFSLELPSDWVEVPQATLSAAANAARDIIPSKQKYDYAYQPASQPWFVPPYILIQVKRTGKASEDQFSDMKKVAIELGNAINTVQNSSSAALSQGNVESVNYDAALHILWSHMSMYVRPGEGRPLVRLDVFTGVRLTEFGQIQLSGYTAGDSFKQYQPIFERAVKQMYLSPEIFYKPGVVARAGGIDWVQVIKMALVGGAIGLFVGFVRKQMKK